MQAETEKPMRSRLSVIYRSIDSILKICARIGSVFMVALVCITMYDVSTRYLSLPKFAGLNSTMVQESEYWAHAFLFTLVIGYGYTQQAHVRIDLVRDLIGDKGKYILELIGIVVLLLPMASLATYYCYGYAYKSFIDAEVSPSTNGLSHFWILKSSLVIMFGLLVLAGISQGLKCIDGLRGRLESVDAKSVLGGGH